MKTTTYLNKLKIAAILIVAAITGISRASAQTVPSSCDAEQQVVSLYQDDADRMALRNTMQNNTTWADSARINPTLSEQYLDALIAVHNAISLPARDTVVSVLDIHTSVTPDMTLSQLSIFADTALSWMKAFKNGQLMTGDSAIDHYLKDYSLDSTYMINLSTINGSAILYFTQNHNLFSLGNKIELLPGVVEAGPTVYFGSTGKAIIDSLYPGFVELTYNYGWSDCPMGCIYDRYWVFRVYPDCSVEYVRSYGDPLPQDFSLAERDRPRISVWPNPFTDYLNVKKPVNERYSYELYDSYGKLHQEGEILEDNRIGIHPDLPKGQYFLKLTSGSGKPLHYQLMK